ncbi:nucleolar protein dao-5-like isoform X5 [Mugil cephalus]|uniref:nucleolar protein dao-5-like isoform X5 n=1 Tax=Mugil cephalus TaxID=48193 RepID=UPI001FB62AE2|nr:nucleolar protein dao-5-like isoform X5 [Mugil cephalus]
MICRIILAYWILTPCLVAGQSTTYGLVGGTVTLKADEDTPDEILWKHKGNKVVEFSGNEQQEFGSFSNRITLDWGSADLTITNLRYEDSGEYVLEVYKNSKLTKSVLYLEVIDKVAKPTISCKKSTDSSTDTSEIQATLTCSSEPGQFQSLLKFQWSSHEEPGPHLTIPLGGKLDDEVYTCTASNPVSEASTTFTAKDCNLDDPNTDSDSIIGIGIGVGVVLAIVIPLALLLFCKLKHKACFAKGNDEQWASHGETGGSTNDENQPCLSGNKGQEKTVSDCDPETHQMSFKQKREIFQQGEKPAVSDSDPETPQMPFEQTREMFERGQPPAVPLPVPKKPMRNSIISKENVAQPREPTKETVSQCDPADPEKMNDVLPGALNDDKSDKTADENKESMTSSANAPLLVFSENSPSKDAEHKEDTNSDQDAGETEEKNNENFSRSVQIRRSMFEPKTGGKNPPDVPKKPSAPALNDDKSDKTADENKESMTSSANAPPLVFSENSPSKDAEHKEDTNSDQDAGGTEEKNNENFSRSVQIRRSMFEPKTGGKNPPDVPKKPSAPALNDDKSDKTADENKESMTSSANAPPLVFSENSPSKDAEHKEDTNSDQDAGETEEKNNENFSRSVQIRRSMFEPNTGGKNPPDDAKKPPAAALKDDKSDKMADENKESMTSSVNAPPLGSSKNSPSKDTERNKDTNSDQDSGGTEEKNNEIFSGLVQNRKTVFEPNTGGKNPPDVAKKPPAAALKDDKSDKMADENEESMTSSANAPPLGSSKNSPSKDTERNKDTNSDQDSGGTEEKNNEIFSGFVQNRKTVFEPNTGGKNPPDDAKKPPAAALKDDKSDKMADENKESMTSSVNAPPLGSSKNSPSKDTERNKDTNSDQDSGGTEEKNNEIFSGLVQNRKTVFEPNTGGKNPPDVAKKPPAAALKDDKSDKMADENEESMTSSANAPPLGSSKNSPSKDTERNKDTNSDQDSGGTEEKNNEIFSGFVQNRKTVFEPNTGGKNPPDDAKKPPAAALKDDKTDKKADENKESMRSSANAPPLVSSENSPSKDAEHNEDTNSDQDAGGTEEKNNENFSRFVQNRRSKFEPKTGGKNRPDVAKKPPAPALNDDKSDKKADENEESMTSSANAPLVFSENSPSKDAEHKEDTNSDQDAGDTEEKNNENFSRFVQNRRSMFEPKTGGKKPPDVAKKPPAAALKDDKTGKKADENKESMTSSANAPPLVSSENSPSKDTDRNKDTNPDQDSGETEEKNNENFSGLVQNRKTVFEPNTEGKNPPDVAKKPPAPALNDDKTGKKADENKESMMSSANAPPLGSPKNSPSKDTERNKDTNSDQDSGETEEKNNENFSGLVQNRKTVFEPNTGGKNPPDDAKKPPAAALNDDKSDQKPDDDKESMTSSANAPPPVSSENSPSQDGEHKEDVNSDQGKESSRLEEGTSPEQKGAEA